MKTICSGCGGAFTPTDGPTHATMPSSPGCWAAYGVLLAREYEAPALFAACHRLTVDAYAVQHVGHRTDQKARGKAWLHLASLELVLGNGRSDAEARRLMGLLAKSSPPETELEVPAFRMTHTNVLDGPLSDHAGLVEKWATSAREDWSEMMPVVREWMRERDN